MGETAIKRFSTVQATGPARPAGLLLAASVAAAAACAAIAARNVAAARGISRLAAPAASGAVARALPEQVPLSVPQGMAEHLAGGGEPGRDAARGRFFEELSRRFRLAGFRLDRRNPEASRAIIEDRDTGRQWMRRKGESLAPSVALSGIGTNAVTLSTPYGAYSLPLSRRGPQTGGGTAGTPAPAAEMLPGPSGGAAARLAGGRTGQNTWVFGREDLMAYYDEVKHRPERLEAVFDTLAPVWYTDEADGSQKIEGYRVEPCGEEEFFAAVGFQEGDVVREVNGIRMDNRYAAEELIRRFAAGDLDFAHIRMERDGAEVIQSYSLK